MKIRYFALLGCLLVLCFFSPFFKEPKLVSSIVSMDTAYLTLLADEREVRDEEEFREKVFRMCLEDDFGEIKLRTEKKGLPQRFHISVYVTEKDLECGSPYLVLECEKAQLLKGF